MCPRCFEDLGALMEKDHKPQWVCQMLLFFKGLLEGIGWARAGKRP